MLERRRAQAEQVPERVRDRPRRPRLRAARDGVAHRPRLGLAARVAGVEFGQPIVAEGAGRLVERVEHAERGAVLVVAAEPGRDQAVVVRPHAAEVIADRVVGGAGAGQRADTPAGEHVVGQQARGHARGARGRGDAAPEHLARVGGDLRDGTAARLPREHVAAELLRPEVALEAHAQRGRAPLQVFRARAVVERAQQHRRLPPRAVTVGLHLAQRDRRLGQRAVDVEDRVARILPPLIDEPVRVPAGVVDVAVAVVIGEAVDPVERRVHVGPQRAGQRQVARPRDVLRDQDQEEQRRIHGAVIRGRLGDRPEPRQLAGAQLVQDLARLRVAIGVDGVRLVAREQAQRVAGRGRAEGQRLDGDGGRVAAEQRREPRHTRAEEVAPV